MATAQQTFLPSKGGVFDKAQLDSRYRYLRITRAGGTAGVVLIAIEETPNGRIEVWRSGDHEIVRLRDGRLAGITGLKPEWHNVALPPFPDWRTLAEKSEPFRWERVRDVMPGYRYGVHDKLVLTGVPAPSSTRLVGVDPKQLTWFEERTESSTEEILPPARYAVQGDRVIYAEQCVARERCFTWQRWPAGS